uniref:LRRCT domain-containing protein n=1 Tax=Arion vulgaris TaxID=1028688 RepID=A0A0B7BLL2_9EUPU
MYSIKYLLIICAFNISAYSMARVTPDPDFVVRNKYDYTYTIYSYRNRSNITQQDFPAHIKFRILSFELGTLTSVPNDVLPIGLFVLQFQWVPLAYIADDAFQASADTLDQLEFTDTNLTSLPNALLSLNNLTSLTITNTNIQYWNITILEHIVPNLKVITLINVGLTSWPSWISSSKSLYFLNFALNSIAYVPDDAFNSLTNTLKQLSLETNGLTEVPKALLNLSQLKQLVLSGNNFKDVNGRPGIEQLLSFPSAKTIEGLFIESIGLTVLPNLSGLTKLTAIKLGYNNISDPTSGSLPMSVTYLQLQFNNLPSVPTVVSNVADIGILDLSNNQITNISMDMLSSKIYYLDLSNNNISEITEAIGTRIYSLDTLNLKFNPITYIAPSAFKSITSLIDLYLDNTFLTELPVALSSLINLRTLTITPGSLTCECPSPPELGKWYQTNVVAYKINNACNNGTLMTDYLSYPCNNYTRTTTTPGGGVAPIRAFILSYTYAAVLLSLVLYISSF